MTVICIEMYFDEKVIFSHQPEDIDAHRKKFDDATPDVIDEAEESGAKEEEEEEEEEESKSGAGDGTVAEGGEETVEAGAAGDGSSPVEEVSFVCVCVFNFLPKLCTQAREKCHDNQVLMLFYIVYAIKKTYRLIGIWSAPLL